MSAGRSGCSSPAGGGPALAVDEGLLRALVFDARGLVPVVALEAHTGELLMVAWANAEAIRRTLETGRAWYFSRSRAELWCKGETSGDRQRVERVLIDCDADTLAYLVRQEGRGACHTGERTCFYRTLGARREGDDQTEGGDLTVADGRGGVP